MSVFDKQCGAAAAFNIFNAESAEAVVRAALSSGRGVYIQTSVSTVKHFGAVATSRMINSFIPDGQRDLFRIHLDHCLDLDMIQGCIDAGWDSVMIDASMKPLDENIGLTRAVVDMAHSAGVLVEGELGAVGGEEDGFDAYASEEAMVELGEVKRFVEETGVDLLAVGVGNRHGHYEVAKKDDPLDIGKLREVFELVPDVSLVLHGGTGVPDHQIRAAIDNGVKKINISTELKESFLAGVREHCEGDHVHAMNRYLETLRGGMMSMALSKINQFK